MKKISALTLRRNVELDPAWASKLTAYIEISDFCELTESPITHLSPFLVFKGRNSQGEVASFKKCKHLGVAEGVFYGHVAFTESGIRAVEHLTIKGTDYKNRAANFKKCKHLKLAAGKFPGFVNFAESGVEKISDLQISEPSRDKKAADFSNCKKLRTAQGNYLGFVEFRGSGIRSIGKLIIDGTDKNNHAAGFSQCNKLKIAKGTFPGFVDFNGSGIEKIEKLDITNAASGSRYKGKKADFSNCQKLKTIPSALFRPVEVLADKAVRELLQRQLSVKLLKANSKPELWI